MTDKKLRILLVENDPIDEMAILRFVREQGLPFDIQTVRTSTEGLQVLRHASYDAVLLDYLLSDGTALDVLPHIKDVPVIVITGNGDEEVAVNAMRRGAYDYLIKDIDRQYLTLLPSTINNVMLRKQAENDFSKSEKRYRTIVETVSDVIFQLDTNRRIVFINSAVRELGYEAHQLLGKPVEELLLPDDREKVGLIATKRVGMRATRNLEVRFQAKHGPAQWFEMKKVALLLNAYGMWDVQEDTVQTFGSAKTFLGTLCIARNITKRKQAEDALRESEMRTRAVMDNVADAIVTLNEDGLIESFNLGGERMFGHRAADVIGKPPGIFFPETHARMFKDMFADFQTAAGAAAHAKPRETQGMRHNGEVFALELALSRVHLGGRDIFIGVMRDVTERKLNEEKLRDYAQRLERSNEDLQGFAYIASHDLQEPLRKIIAFGDRLYAKFQELLGDDGGEYLKKMQAAAARMQLLIDDLLQYSRVATRANRFEIARLERLVGEVLVDLEVRLAQTGGKVEIDSLPVVYGDKTQLRQLFQNLISNALKFARDGTPPVIKLSARRTDGAYWEVTVEDNGIGFEQKYAEKIFKPFERLHGLGKYEGSGIGLAICHKIITRHGGMIAASGTPGQGAKFTLTLPAEPRAENKEAPSSAPAA